MELDQVKDFICNRALNDWIENHDNTQPHKSSKDEYERNLAYWQLKRVMKHAMESKNEQR